MPGMDEKRRQDLAGKGPGKTPPPPVKPTAPIQEQPPAPAITVFKIPAAPGPCGACGSELKVIKINSRVRAWACVKKTCRLYRQWVKVFSLPAPVKPRPVITKGEKHGDKNKVNPGNQGRHQKR